MLPSALALAWLAVPAGGAAYHPVGDTGWQVADPPGFALNDSDPGRLRWNRSGEGRSAEIDVNPFSMEIPAKPEHCDKQEMMDAFNDIHPTYTTFAYTCGERFFRYVLLTGQIHRDPVMGDTVRVVQVTYKSFGDPVRPGQIATIRKVLSGLEPQVGVGSKGAAAGPPKEDAAGPAPARARPARPGPGRAPAKRLSWRELAGQVMAEGSEVLLRGSEAKSLGLPDPSPVKALEYAGEESTDGAARAVFVTVRLAPGTEDIEPTGILLRMTARGRAPETRLYKVSLRGKLESATVVAARPGPDDRPLPGSEKARKMRVRDELVQVWFEVEAEFHLKGEHRISAGRQTP